LTNKTFRNIQRTIHIIAGSLLAIYIYSPWSSVEAFSFAIKWVALPILILSGIAMWQLVKVRKLFK
jgi:hypothetical protein